MRYSLTLRKFNLKPALLGGLVLLLTALLTACGDNTSTAAPAATTEAAMMVPTKTEGAMMAGTTAAMVSGTPGAMMSGSPEAMMAGPAVNGSFDHMTGPKSVSGTVALVEDSVSKKYVLTFSNLQITGSGAGLHVWYSKEADLTKLTTPAQVKSGLDLGPLKALSGDQTYPLDASIDVTQYKAVVIYDNATDSVFGAATLSKAK